MSVTSLSDLIAGAPSGRKLFRVMFADMVNYSRLLGWDDVGTLERFRYSAAP